MGKKILQINVCLNVLSIGRITEQIGQTIKDYGWESYVATYGPIRDSQSAVIRVTGHIERFLHRVINRFLDAQGFGSYFATWLLIRKINQIDPDVIHLQDIHDCWLNHPLLFNYIVKKQKPIVWTFHDCWAITGHCAYFDDANCEKWITGCNNCPLRNRFSLDLSKFNYKFKKNKYNEISKMVIVPVSYWLEDISSKSLLKNYPIQTIHNGIDLGKFKPTRGVSSKNADKKEGRISIIGVSANWGKSKGFEEFVQLGQDKRFIVVMIGVPNNMKALLPPSVICIERTDSQEQLAEYYTEADVFVNPTYHDNFPTVNLEALACGTPIVTYRTGGSPEAICDRNGNVLDERLGAVVECGNYEALVKKIIKLGSVSPSYKEERSKYCRDFAEKNYNKDKCYKSYIEIYKDLLDL